MFRHLLSKVCMHILAAYAVPLTTLYPEVASVRTIADMPDPEGLYSSTLGLADFSKSSINVPNVRDGNGAIIRPEEYAQKLDSGMIVMVNVYMKL